jgi:curli biogenesis system outer membrane secretion channel CsgG
MEASMRTSEIRVVLRWMVVGACLGFVGCLAPPGQPTAKVTDYGGPSVGEARSQPYFGPKARIAVGDFQVKAAGAPYVIGDGLREMLVTALFNTNRFIVLERSAMGDVIREQDFGASGRVLPQTAAPMGRIEGTQMMVYGAVTEFQMGTSGGGVNLVMPNIPFQFGGNVQNAHMAIDMRVVDMTSGRILYAGKVEGKTSDYATSIGTQVGGGATTMPITLNSFQNTPMEKAIRVCIEQAVAHLCTKMPPNYFQY